YRGFAGAGRPPKDERAKRARVQHAGERTIRAEQMVLADDVRQLVGAKLVGQRSWRRPVEAGSREQARIILFRARTHRMLPYPLPATLGDTAISARVGSP